MKSNISILTLSDDKYQLLICSYSKESFLITNQYPHKTICNIKYSNDDISMLESAEAEYLLRNLKDISPKPISIKEFYGI